MPAAVASADTDHQTIEQTWQEYQISRDPKLQRILFEHYLPDVDRLAARMVRRLPAGVEVEDLAQEGTFGLADAIDRFDPDKGFQFSTFASQRIRGAIIDYLRSVDWVSRITRDRHKRVNRALDRFRVVHGHAPTDQELTQHLGLDDREAGRFHGCAQIPGIVSMSAEHAAGDRDKAGRLSESIKDQDARDPLTEAQRQDIKDQLTRHLSRAERLIVILYYYEGMTMREVGLTLDISESRVSQMHSLIVARLKVKLEGKEDQLHLLRERCP